MSVPVLQPVFRGVSPWFAAALLWLLEPAVVEHEGRVNSSALVVALKEEQTS